MPAATTSSSISAPAWSTSSLPISRPLAENMTRIRSEEAAGLDLAVPELGVDNVISGLGHGSALAVDPKRGDVCVVDPSARAILRWNPVGDGYSEPVVTPLPEELLEPTLVKIANDGTLWVADGTTAKAFHFSVDGELIQTLE